MKNGKKIGIILIIVILVALAIILVIKHKQSRAGVAVSSPAEIETSVNELNLTNTQLNESEIFDADLYNLLNSMEKDLEEAEELV